ncbi:MAG: TetR/AcrR family transcriptional regulator [Phycisphaeraceae bacterium]|nr:TetR/AcrR family transcriptional regulator [Phycisphaeraceae bacterium]
MTALDPRILETGTPEAPASSQTTLNREQILEATFHCLIEDGYDATTIRRIAKRLGCAIGSIYRYFTDKRQLLYAVTQELLEPVAKMVELGASFEQTVAQYSNVAANDGEAYRLMFWLACHDPSEGEGVLPPVVRRIVAGWGRQLGDVRRAHQCWAMLHGAIILGASAQEAAAWLSDLTRTTRPSYADKVQVQPTPEATPEAAPEIAQEAAPVAEALLAQEPAKELVMVVETTAGAALPSTASSALSPKSDDVTLL